MSERVWHPIQASPSRLPAPCAACAWPPHQRRAVVYTEIWKAGNCLVSCCLVIHLHIFISIFLRTAQWFIQRYGKLVIEILAKIITSDNMITLDKSSSKAVEPIEAVIWGFGPLRLDFTSAHTQLLSSTTMRTREIFSTKTSCQALSSFFIFPPSCNIEQPILGRPDSFVYRFRMLGGKLGFEQKNNWNSSY